MKILGVNVQCQECEGWLGWFTIFDSKTPNISILQYEKARPLRMPRITTTAAALPFCTPLYGGNIMPKTEFGITLNMEGIS